MPIDLRNVATDVALFDLEYSGMTMPVSYRPSVMTGRFMSRMSLGLTPVDLADALCQIIVSWDLMGDDGEPVPLTQEGVLEVPLALLRAVFEGIQTDSSDVGKASAASNAG